MLTFLLGRKICRSSHSHVNYALGFLSVIWFKGISASKWLLVPGRHLRRRDGVLLLRRLRQLPDGRWNRGQGRPQLSWRLNGTFAKDVTKPFTISILPIAQNYTYTIDLVAMSLDGESEATYGQPQRSLGGKLKLVNGSDRSQFSSKSENFVSVLKQVVQIFISKAVMNLRYPTN